MKKTALAVCILLAMGIFFAWTPVFGIPEPVKMLRDFLFQPPNSVYQQYGYSEETFLFYNIIANKENTGKLGADIVELKKQVAMLKQMQKNILRDIDGAGIPISDPPFDPNEGIK